MQPLALCATCGIVCRNPRQQKTTCCLERCRTWCLAAVYAFNFGVELTVNNIITTYILDNFDASLPFAGLCGATFGLMNLFSRSLGGYVSDWAAGAQGMRGRLWVLFVSQARSFMVFMVFDFIVNSESSRQL